MEEITITGDVLSIEYAATETAFAVIKLKTEDGVTTAVGPLGHVGAGCVVTLKGFWKFHPSYGEQFDAKSALIQSPQTLHGITLYLQSQMSGVGKKTAQRIVEQFGLQTLQVLNESPHRLAEVKGISAKKASRISEQWVQDVQTRELEITLRGYGISLSLCLKLVRKYKSEALQQVLKHPYQLCEDFKGIGFKTADNIALSQGILPTAPQRLLAIVQYALRQSEQNGDCFTHPDDMIELASSLDVSEDLILEATSRAMALDLVSLGPDEISLQRPIMHHTEKKIAKHLSRILRIQAPKKDIDSFNQTIQLNEEQINAVNMGINTQLSIITGGPGTGKTTTVKVLMEVFASHNENIVLAAPTGRAAKRLSEATGHEAQTIHRLLKINEIGIFTHNEDNPLDADGVLVDEASMLDVWLFLSVLKALPEHGKLILVGDIDQLPSVGPGQVLKDIIDSGCVSTTRLQQVYRQGQNSNIIKNAHQIRQGIPAISCNLDPEAAANKDFFIIDRDTQEASLETIRHIYQTKLPALGFDLLKDVQILTPMHGGILGTNNINKHIQELINPNTQSIQIGQKVFKLGDRVIQLRNDYESGLFNGDVGYIRAIEDGSTYIEFDGVEGPDKQSLLYPQNWIGRTTTQLQDLELAYAISIHKSQGSEYPCVIMAIHKSHWIMLRRNLVYTAMTRAKQFCCVVGSEWALKIATTEERLEGRTERRTWLRHWIQEACPQIGN